MENFNKWTGASKLVFSVDIGTMQSAISFVYLEHDKIPAIKHVTGWPGEPLSRAKTLTSMYYDKTGGPCSYGIDTQSAPVKEKARVEQWTLVHSFKRYIHRLGVSAELSNDADVQPLPPNVTETKLYTDWLKFLFNHAKQVVSNELSHSGRSWSELLASAELVFTVPNGWYTQEHAILRNAAVDADVVAKLSAVRFVPETEAAVHWALHQGDLQPKAGTDFIVCDSGGSTTDIAMYKVISTSPLQLCEKEGNPSKCIEAGSALINDGFNDLIRDKLDDDDGFEVVEAQVAQPFEREKAEFDGSKPAYQFNFGGEGAQPEKKHIQVTRDQMAELFDDVIDKIIVGIDDMLAHHDSQFLLLRGDFGYSPYFQKKLRAHFKKMKLIPASEHNVKAAAAGALVWLLKRSVVARAARFSLGQQIDVVYNPMNQEHIQRGAVARPSGQYVQYGWYVVVPRGALLKDGEEHRKSFIRTYSNPNSSLGHFSITVYLADVQVEKSKWIREKNGALIDGFREMCEVTADLSSRQGKLQQKYGSYGVYWELQFDVSIAFGSTALEAHVLWKDDDGHTHGGPATIIPAQFIE
ncbi:hypothetical protein SCHPADRAFT_852762 [Schizopora paradoxa]|uniref:Actin-like ATPase domain-containing protein n=1 Tax=Schizopora paradoxa TaxID=27342 RepID=A0A0H2RNT3_9AGAM|nr:hypothetical protein SCHPADRAFT_852762 [Schizopora paradoxa]